jgi:lysozyme
MNDDLHLSPAGANLIKAFEGLLKKIGLDQYKAYVCPAGVTTIGWGTTAELGRKLSKDTCWTKAQCDEAFLNDMKVFEKEVKRLVKVKLTQYQFDALTSFCYNCGSGKSSQEHSLEVRELRRLQAGGARVQEME